MLLRFFLIGESSLSGPPSIKYKGKQSQYNNTANASDDDTYNCAG
jgi:hypothetical protein